MRPSDSPHEDRVEGYLRCAILFLAKFVKKRYAAGVLENCFRFVIQHT